MHPHRYYLVLEALEPIAHGDTLSGIANATNTRLFMRSAQRLHGRSGRIPDISENALRSAMFRYPLHDHLLRTLDIARGTLPQPIMNLLFSGGAMASGVTQPEDAFVLGHAIKRLYPSLDLLGGAVDSFILPRSRLRLAAWPVTHEYAWVFELLGREAEAKAAQEVSIFDLLWEETRTRGTGDESAGNQMMYTYETLAAGTRVLIELTLDVHTPETTLGTIALAVAEWDGYFGGQGRQGRGRMAIIERPPLGYEAYDAQLIDEGTTMRDGLLDGSLGCGRPVCIR